MSSNSGIFGLSEYHKKNLVGEIPDKSRESYREYGYFGGGNVAGSTNSIVERIDFSNDTRNSSRKSSLSLGKQQLAAVGNSNFGYFGSGTTTTSNQQGLSTVERIDYSNDVTSPSIRGFISSKYQPGASGNNDFGYFSGGAITSVLDRIDYSNDLSNGLIRGYLPASTSSATGNLNFGWFGGGFTGSFIRRLDYSNDTSPSLIRGSFSPAGGSRAWPGATGNNNFGYFGGGFSGSSRLDRINYTNDTTVALSRGALTASRYGISATGNSNFGYFDGGTSRLDRIDYSNDTQTALSRGAQLVLRRWGGATSSASFGGSPVSYLGSPWVSTSPYGYTGGGFPLTDRLDRIDYSNDTAVSSIKSKLNTARYHLDAVGNSSYGYFAGGFVGSPATVSSLVDRLDYSSDNSSPSIRGNLIRAIAAFASSGTSNFGYLGAGNGGPNLSLIYRYQYSNDTNTEISRSTVGSQWLSSVGNSNFGYYAGGSAASTFSRIDRLDYSTDTTTASRRSNLSLARLQAAGTGNNNYGYFGGGYAPTSRVDRLEYANDTTNAIIRGPLSSAKNSINNATGSSDYGYFSGGFISGTATSIIDRIDYSSDTQTASIRGRLSLSRAASGNVSSQYYGGAPNTTIDPLPTYLNDAIVWSGNNALDIPFKRILGSYSYFAGGSSSTRVDRIDYSNDLTTASIRGNLNLQQNTYASFSNRNFGYIVGNIFTPTSQSTINRIDYSNDLAVTQSRSNNNGTWVFINALGNSKFGYNIGGAGSGAPRSVVFRLDYSTDTSSMPARGNLRLPVCKTGTTSNEYFGYYGGGSIASNENLSSTTVGRINFSNDNTISSIRGPLTTARLELAATGNDNYGYFSGSPSSIDRVDYSNDLVQSLIRGSLSVGRTGLAASGNSNFGYFGGGYSTRSTVDRINYSNDSVNASTRGNLSQGRSRLASVTNSRNS